MMQFYLITLRLKRLKEMTQKSTIILNDISRYAWLLEWKLLSGTFLTVGAIYYAVKVCSKFKVSEWNWGCFEEKAVNFQVHKGHTFPTILFPTM